MFSRLSRLSENRRESARSVNLQGLCLSRDCIIPESLLKPNLCRYSLMLPELLSPTDDAVNFDFWKSIRKKGGKSWQIMPRY